MKLGIMPHGYSIEALRKRRVKELQEQRAKELAGASPDEQRRIRQEIESTVEKEIKKLAPNCAAPVLW